jgi:hypothetical protein
VGIGAVLVQHGQPVTYMSRKMIPAERNYTTTEQELLAVVKALKEWRCYLEGTTFTVVTDHCPNTFFQQQPVLSRRQARWYVSAPCRCHPHLSAVGYEDPCQAHNLNIPICTFRIWLG